MKLSEIRKQCGATREIVGMLNGITIDAVRGIERKSLKDITFSDIDIYVTALGISDNEIITKLLNTSINVSELKGVFWEHSLSHIINVNKTYTSIKFCSNACSLLQLYSYINTKNYFNKIKLNWCYYKLKGEEIP